MRITFCDSNIFYDGDEFFKAQDEMFWRDTSTVYFNEESIKIYFKERSEYRTKLYPYIFYYTQKKIDKLTYSTISFDRFEDLIFHFDGLVKNNNIILHSFSYFVMPVKVGNFFLVKAASFLTDPVLRFNVTFATVPA